jgi:nucleotide-binding universal stress UspA family protein
LLDAGKTQFDKSFDQLREKSATLGIDTVLKLCVGYPAQQVLHYAEQQNVHHIVTGRRGISALQRWSMGSVSQRIVLHATSITTVVP